MNQAQLLAEIAETQNFIQLVKVALRVGALNRRYDPDQPRVPAGSPDGGQWAGGDGGERSSPSLGQMLAARRHSLAYCEQQYERDLIECRIVRLSSCYSRAMYRRPCIAGLLVKMAPDSTAELLRAS